MLSRVHLAFHARIQDFTSGGGGGGGGGGVRVNLTKKSPDNVFFQSSTYFTEVKWLISKKTIFFHGSREGPTFSRGGGESNFFQGVQLPIPYRNPYNL